MYFLDTNKWLKNPLRIHHNPKALIGGKAHPEELYAILESGKSYNFTFIRRPDRRIYSCFVEKICLNQSAGYVAVKKRIAEEYNLRFDERPELDLANHRRNFLAFLDFVKRNLAGQEKIRGRGHWQRQATIIDVRGSLYPIHFIGLTERILPHLNHVLQEAGTDRRLSDIPQFNESTAATVRYDDIVDDEIRSAMKSVYQSDFSLYEEVEKKTIHIK